MGQLIEFYYPAPKPKTESVTPPAPPEQGITASDVLREVLGKAEGLQDVVILHRDRHGELGVVSSLESMGDIVLFVEVIQQEMVTRFRASLTAPPSSPNKPA